MNYKSSLRLLTLFATYCLSNAALAETQILKASTIITMDEKNPRAEAVAFDTVTKKITAIGSLSEVQAKAPQAKVTDLGATVLMPGFIEPHGHPATAGLITQPPTIWIAPYVGYKTWDDVKAKILKEDAQATAGMPLIFNGVDKLLQQAPTPTRDILDALTPSGRLQYCDNQAVRLGKCNTAKESLGRFFWAQSRWDFQWRCARGASHYANCDAFHVQSHTEPLAFGCKILFVHVFFWHYLIVRADL
ncbi:MAG: hypothetical protein RI904_2119 [Pseudomonadota bacterium]